MMMKIDDIEKKNPFKVPDNYFENLNERILGNILSETNRKRKVVNVINLKPFLAIAASVVLIVVIGLSVLFNNTGPKQEVMLTKQKTDYINELALENIDISYLEDEVSGLWSEPIFGDLEIEDIIHYLENENISISEIYEFY